MPDENQLYEEWSAATDRREIEERLYRAVSRHAAAVVFSKFPEAYQDLIPNIAAAVMGQLGEFRGESKFSTWVHSIALNKTNEALRSQGDREKVFDDTKVIVSAPRERTEEHSVSEGGESLPSGAEVYAVSHPDFDSPMLLEEICRQLTEEEASLIGYKGEGLTSEEIGAKLGIGREALDSRWARLKKKLRERDGERGSQATN